MAQLLLMGAKLACGIPGAHVIGPVALSLVPVSPINILCYLGWLLGLKLSKANWTKKLAPTWKKAALWALCFYFATTIPLYFVILLVICKSIR